MPGLRERLYGSFRLDFGVYVPEMNRTHVPRRSWINDYDCHLRKTIGELVPGASDGFWWTLDDPEASARAGMALQEYGLPWLDAFPGAESVLDGFNRLGPLALGLTPAGPLDIADLYRARGNTENDGCWQDTSSTPSFSRMPNTLPIT